MRNTSYRFRLVSSESNSVNYTSAIRAEGLSLYERTAAIVCRPGTPKKTMDVLVAKAWGNIAVWRARACRLGEAGAFSAASVRQIQVEFERFVARERAAASHAEAIARALHVPETEEVRLGRAEYDDLVNRIRALEAALRL